jgi:hypothetical protein
MYVCVGEEYDDDDASFFSFSFSFSADLFIY